MDTETREFKKTLALLAVTVIGAEAAAFLLSAVMPFVFYFLKVRNWGEDAKYLALWTANDIIMYAPALAVFYRVFKNRGNYENTAYRFKIHHIFLLFAAAYTATNAASYLTHFIEYAMRPIFGGNGLRDVFENVMPESVFQTAVMFFFVVIAAPVCEELIFRSILLKPLRRYGDTQAVIITSVLFGFFHGNLTQFLYAAAGGVILGIAAVRANSVAASIYVHLMINAVNMIDTMLYGASDLEIFADIRLISYFALLITGLISLINLMRTGGLKLENHNPHLTSAERTRIVLKNPFIIITAIVLIVITVRG